jgi:pyrroline-5-carboxylate reductase
MIERLLSVFGRAVRIEEGDMNAATALTAVGPTYVLPVIHALASAAESLGIQRKDALAMVADVVAGTAHLVMETGREPEELKLMIGTRTLKEGETAPLFTRAYLDAFGKITASEKKLIS